MVNCIKIRICQIIYKPVFIRIYCHIISCIFYDTAECLCNFCDLFCAQFFPHTIFFQIIVNRIRKIISFDQTKYMIGFAFCCRHTVCIRINISTKRNSFFCTCICICLPIWIILTCLIISISTTYNCIIYICCLYFCPVNVSIPLTYINSFGNSSFDFFSLVIIEFPVFFIPRIRRTAQIFCCIRQNWGSIFVSPAVASVFSLCLLWLC